MGFNAKIILDSLAPCGKRLTSVEVTYPRFVHAETLTHRAFARNSASSRAIPFSKLNRMVATDPVIPIKWGMEQGGMQTGDDIPEALRPLARSIWLKARDSASEDATALHNIEETAARFYSGGNREEMLYGMYLTQEERDVIGRYILERGISLVRDKPIVKVHKSLPNRIIEPWMWITVLITATEWKNFFRLRCHPHAEIHMQQIAYLIRDAIEQSAPTPLPEGAWHRPYITPEDHEWVLMNQIIDDGWGSDVLNKVSAARCARLSYLNFDKIRSITDDLKLYDKLVQGSGFGHWSPHEHVARAESDASIHSGPFVGWMQFRKLHPEENADG